MKSLLRSAIPVTAAALILGFSTDRACGQASKVDGGKPSFDSLLSPEFPGPTQKRGFTPKNWLEVEAELKVALSPEPPSKTLDRMTVKWYVAVKNPDGRGMLLLTKDVEHVNIPLNESIYTSVYLSPASLTRLTGSDRGGKNAIEVVAYEVLIDGRAVASETSKMKTGWWTAPSLSRSEAVPLLNKTETPFANHWWDRYAEVAPLRR